MTESHCEFTVSFGQEFKADLSQTSQIAANSQHNSMALRVWSHFHSDSLQLTLNSQIHGQHS